MTAGRLSEDICVLRPFDGWIDLARMFPITAGGTTCRELFQFYRDDKYAGYYTPDYASRLPDVASAEPGALVIGGVPNYWHFMVDHAARIPAALVAEHSTIIITPALPQTFQDIARSIASYVGVQATIKEAPGELIRVTGATVPCVIPLSWRVWFLRAFGASLQQEQASKAERVFIWRGETSVRRLVNETELATRLEALGFVVVDPARLTVAEQINAVANARIIVGGHGAGLTNAIFAPKLQQLVECFAVHPQAFFEDASLALGHRHYFVEGEPIATNVARADDAHYRVDSDLLLRAVDTALRPVPA